jgi:hypothetical protein
MYKKGQKLRCIKPGGSRDNPLIEGAIYTYVGPQYSAGYDPLILVEGHEGGFFRERFVPVNKLNNKERIRRREACCK